jgi:hypothetical protein
MLFRQEERNCPSEFRKPDNVYMKRGEFQKLQHEDVTVIV